MKHIRLVMVMMSALAVTACDKNPSGNEGNFALQSITDPSAALRQLPEKQLLDMAFKTAFKQADSADLTIDDVRYTYHPAALRWVGNRAILISNGEGEDCQACSGMLAVHYLDVDKNGFVLKGAWPGAAQGSSNGAPPEWTIRTDLASVPVLQTEAGGTAQGYSCSVAKLLALTPEKPVTIAQNLQMQYSEAGAILDNSKAQNIIGTIKPISRDQSFAITYSGTRNGQVVYRRLGNAYQKQSGTVDIPTC